MGRGRSRDQQPLPLEKPVARKLSPEEYDRVAHQLAVKGLAIRGLKRELRTTTSETRKEIKRYEAEQATLEDMLISHEHLLAQRDLKLSPVEAVKAITAVATVAGDTPPKEPATAAHTFVPDKKGEGTCWACGKPKDDAMHGAAPPAPVHVGVDLAPGDDVTVEQRVEVPSKPPEEPPAKGSEEPEGELLATIGPHAYKHVRQSPGVCGVCGVKRRQHATAAAAPAIVPTEPHAFFATAAGPDCRICGSGPNDPVHTSAVAAGVPQNDNGSGPAGPFDFDEGEPRPQVISSRPLTPETSS